MNIQKIVEKREKELEKYVNVLVQGTQVKTIEGKRYNRPVTVQLFIDEQGEIKLARVL